ncbi:DUF262 domain-containing HNH endonuclease family protein [Salegentibacter sp. JZCK2]|uniref:DUF262 domain-containing protein n=1 Tax=Salegentibacter tibetensis TaxID=2873600 RepID=UPI001CCBBF4C|nr:DUF262 domain-containing protein [Salegentibacter tibetensis]MBZ9730783.1 DUF262 domain-containing HNH endonuclease family protein [Salegentibacter tibetensis]
MMSNDYHIQEKEDAITNGFSINASTCTLKYNSQKNGGTIFGHSTNYVIPIYQRPYSWTDEEVRKFLSDIFSSYWGNEGHVLEEPMFIGTMQLSDKNGNNEQDIIDGQQRLTTFFVLLKVLSESYPTNSELQSMTYDWLSTRVNNGEQQRYLEEAIKCDLTFNDETLNPYLKNAFLIKEVIAEQLNDENDQSFDIDRFIKHLFSNIYFVVIETHAGLSKTLQIFNAINTTGLDLNGGDIFKIKMYEYLRDKKNMDESAFEEISRLYQKIGEQNKALEHKASDILDVLSIYQFILIAKYNLPVVLYTYATETFYERLFDTIFKINQWEHFKNNVKNLELTLEEIERIIDMRYEWERNWYRTAEDACAYSFIAWSRYGRYWRLLIVFLFRFREEENFWGKFFLFTRQLSKLYVIYSIRFLRAVNELHKFTYSLTKELMTISIDEVIEVVNKKIGTLDDHKGWGDFEVAITGDITYNRKVKDITCRLSAMLEENYKTTDKEEIDTIREKLFHAPIDIEHIQAYNDIKEEQREQIWKEWGDYINSIGNLVVLEYNINRSIRNYDYTNKLKRYPESCYGIIGSIISEYPEWHLESCKKRKEKEVDKILNYIFP